MTDKWEDEKFIVDILRYCNVWRTEEVDAGLREIIARIRAEASEKSAREERERCALRARAWMSNKRFLLPNGNGSGFCVMSDVDALCSAILTPESASEPKLEEHDLYVYDDAKPSDLGPEHLCPSCVYYGTTECIDWRHAREKITECEDYKESEKED